MATAERNYSLNFSGRLPVEAQNGMKICYENSDPFWRTIINYCIWEAARKHAEFTVDQVIEQMDIVNAERAKKNQPLIETHNLAALGQAMKNSAKDGVIAATNATLRSKRPKSHGNLLRVWKSNFCTKIPLTNEQAMAVSRDGDVPEKTCAYRADCSSKPAATLAPKGSEANADRAAITGASQSTVTKREARRTDTSEFGLMGTAPETSGTPGNV